jgi:hypothetical protein
MFLMPVSFSQPGSPLANDSNRPDLGRRSFAIPTLVIGDL